jgi:3-hydroxyacyl-CoA dehydrogenase
MALQVAVTDGVAVLAISNPPVNALGAQVRAGLAAALDASRSDPRVRAIVLTGAAGHFSAGADIREFGREPPAGVVPLHELIERVERLDKPVVAALHGTVAGGAFELALACHGRVAAEDARMALPEVTLGFIPGAGGTQRLPRLCGLATALDLIVSGRPIGAAEAQAAGIVDEVTPLPALVTRAIAYAARLAEGAPRRTSARPAPPADPGVFARFEAEIARASRGRQAPHAALACVRDTLGLPFHQGLQIERERFLPLRNGHESRALRHLFFAERAACKPPAGAPAPAPVRSVGVVGFGTMGTGIAMAFANAGFPVRVRDESPEALERGRRMVEKAYTDAVARGRLSPDDAAARLSRIACVSEDAALGEVDVVVEAVFEEMEAKQAVFARLDAVCRKDALLATNTSSLDVERIARATADPSRVVGLHFFSPAHVMKLVEIVRPRTASAAALAGASAVVRQTGKIGVVVGVCDGFAGNRMLFAYRRQADFLLEEGALPFQVDEALRGFGMAMGPFETSDLAGLDVSWRIRKRQAAGRPPGARYAPLADRLCERGRFGQKTGAGWYRYEPGSRTPVRDPEVEDLVRARRAEMGISGREITADEIVERCLAALVNEGALILEEGVAERAGDLDVIWVNGYGFPRHQGGPMFWAEAQGLDRIAAVVERLHHEQGELVRPSGRLRVRGVAEAR